MPILHMETDAVQNTGNLLERTADSLAQQTQQLTQSVRNLASLWQGSSQELFMAEIEPILRQVLNLADAGFVLNRRLQREVAEWLETDAAFGSRGAAPTGEYTRSYTVPDVELSTAQWNFRPNDIIGYDPYAVWEGADQEKLSHAMADLSRYLHNNPDLVVGPPYTMTNELQSKLQALADARGINYDEALNQYSQFVQLTNGDPPAPTSRDDYWGSVQQLRYGKVVGDSLGIDPVFGALLAPKGGLIGPGDSSLHDSLKSQEFMLYHGVFHDAAGYLDNNQNGLGPGYEYLLPGYIDDFAEISFGGPVSGTTLKLLLDKYPFLDGQETGIAYWVNRMALDEISEVVDGGLNNLDGLTGKIANKIL